MLSIKKLRLHGTRKFQNHFVGPFIVVERIGNMAYHLDLSCSAALSGVHNVFHVLLLCGWLSNGVHADVPSIEIDGKAEYKVSEIKGHREHQGEMQYLTLFVGFDSSEDM